MGDSSNWSAQTLHEYVVVERDGVVIKIAAIGPDPITSRFEIWRHRVENGNESSTLLVSRSTEKRARRYHFKYTSAMYRAGWIPVMEKETQRGGEAREDHA